MSKEIKLLPCPFCGGEAEIRHYEDYTKDFASVYKYYVECTECKAQSNMKANTEDIIKDWNTRKPIDRIVNQLEESVAYYKKYGDSDGLQYTAYESAIEIVKAGGVE